MSKRVECLICNNKLKNVQSLKVHLKKQHGLSYIEYKERFDLYPTCEWCNKKIRSEKPRKFCDNRCRYKYTANEKTKNTPDIPYCRICGLKGKSLITHINMVHGMSLYEYMNKFELEKSDVHHKSYLNNISDRVSGKNNPGYKHRGRLSPFSKKFIKYDNLDEEDKEKSVNSTFKNRKERAPEDNPCRMEYYLKFTNGNIENAEKLYREKQATFSLEKCTEKYGEEQGYKIWKERQNKWLSSYKKLNYSKISQKLFWGLYNIIKDDFNEIYFATLDKNKTIDESGKNYEYKIETNKSFVKLDFFIKDVNKAIEFDGDYWHGEKRGNQERDRIREESIMNQNPEMKILHVKERDYKNNPEEVIRVCKEFIYG